MVRYIHSGDEAEDNKKQKQTTGPESAEQGSDSGSPAEKHGEGNSAAAGKSGEAEATDELGLLAGQGQTESAGDNSRDTGTEETDEASSGETESEEETTETLAAIRTGTISAAIVTAAEGCENAGSGKEEQAKADGAETVNENGGEAGSGTASSGGTEAGASAQGGEGQHQSGEDSDESGSGENGSGVYHFFNVLFGSESGNEGTTGQSAGNQDPEAQAEPGVDPQSEGASNLEASSSEGESAKANGGEEAAAGGQSQDMEASGELGAEEQEGGKKGFFARLFGDDADDREEDSGSDEEPGTQSQAREEANASGGSRQQAETQPEKPKKNKKQAGQKENVAEEKIDPLQLKRDTERSDSLEQSVIYWQGIDKISPSLEETKNTLTEVMGLGSSYDLVFREMSFGGRKVALVCVSGFANDGIIDEILKRLTYLTPEDVSSDVMASFMNEYIPHVQVEKGDLLSESINKVLAGMSVFFIEGETQAIVMDTRSYPARSPDEPSIERVVRGARDGFTETLQSNVALVRRRIRDPGLKYEIHQIGRRTRTDVCVAYIDDIVDKTQVKAVTDKIKSVNIDGIPLADKQLEEAIVGAGWNPYPLVRYSERPDVVASHLLEGRVVIFVDTSPSVIVLPTTFFDLCQHAEENRQTPFIGTYLRWVRFIGIFASMFLLPLWMLMVIHPELLPPMLDFIGPQKTAKIPLLAQFLIVELGVDLLRMAAVHTPTPLGSAMGLIAAILVGDIAVQTGLFVNEVVLYMAVASIGMFATPSYELGLANRIVRLVLLVAVAAFQVQGFMIGTTLLIILLTLNRSYNSSYLWPFIPFNAKAMGEIILRQPVLSSRTRPSFNKTRDNTRMPPYQKRKDPS